MMIIGYILIILGIFGVSGSVVTIKNDLQNYYYTYSSPYTSHETTMLTLLFICMVMLMLGIAVIIFTVLKKRNEDQLNKVNNYGNNGTIKNVCPNCGLNLSDNATICPKCGTKVKKEWYIWHELQ
mgnify:FL=1